MVPFLLMPLFIIIINYFSFSKSKEESQELLLTCRGCYCQLDSLQKNHFKIDHSIDYIAQIQKQYKESQKAPILYFYFVQRAANFSTIVINLNDPKEYAIHSQHLLLQRSMDSYKSLNMVEKCKECFIEKIPQKSCRVFLFGFDQHQNQWITYSAQETSNLKLISENYNFTLHEICYLKCNSSKNNINNHQKKVTKNSTIPVFGRMITDDQYVSSYLFGCLSRYYLGKHCNRECQQNIITLRNYIQLVQAQISFGSYYQLIGVLLNIVDMCVTLRFIFKSKYIFETINLFTFFGSNFSIDFYESPFTNENCSPSCVLLLEGQFQELVAFIIPIKIFLNQGQLYAVEYGLMKPVCEAFQIPESQLVESKLIINTTNIYSDNQNIIFTSEIDSPIQITIFVDKIYQTQSNLMVHSIQYTNYDFNSQQTSHSQYINSYWCSDYLNYLENDKLMGVIVNLQFEQILSAEITITMWFQAEDDTFIEANSEYKIFYTQQTILLNLLQSFKELHYIDQVSFYNAVALIICSIIIGMICAYSQILKQTKLSFQKQKIRLPKNSGDLEICPLKKQHLSKENY